VAHLLDTNLPEVGFRFGDITFEIFDLFELFCFDQPNCAPMRVSLRSRHYPVGGLAGIPRGW
jgi:hypothetical protein